MGDVLDKADRSQDDWGLETFASDDTKRKVAEEALHESEARYRRLVDSLPDVVYAFSDKRGGIYYSPSVEEILGYPPAYLLDHPLLWHDSIHSDDLPKIDKAIARFDQSKGITAQYRIKDAEGNWRWLHDRSIGWRIEGGETIIEGVATDITERKRAEEEVEQRNRELATLLEISRALTTTLDLDIVLQTSINSAVDLVGLGSGAIYVLEGETLYLGATTPPLPPEFPEEFRRASLADHPHIRQAIASGRSVILPDTATADLTPAERAVSEMRGLRSIIYTPLLAAERVVGVWIVASVGEPRLFSDAEIGLCHTLSTQVALAVENAQLYDQIKEHAETLQQRVAERKQAEEEIRRRAAQQEALNRIIAAAVVTPNLLMLLETALEQTLQATELEAGAIWAIGLHVVRGLSDELSITLGRAAQAAGLSVDSSFRVDDWQQLPDQNPLAQFGTLAARAGIRAALIVPLPFADQQTGALALTAPEPRTWSTEEIALVEAVGQQLGAAADRLQLEETQRRLSTIVEQAAESIVVTDTDGAILYVNPAFERTNGFSRAEAIGQNPRILKSGSHDDDFYRELWETITSGQVWQGRLVNRKKEGALYTGEAVISPVRNQAGEIVSFVAALRDVTREVELEEQFRQAQKMEALGRLAAGVAHDFNNLLTVIQISSHILARQLRSEDPLWTHVQRVQDAARTASGLTRQLLAFSRQEVIAPQIVCLNDVIRELGRMLQRIVGEHIELAWSLEDDLWPVLADPSQFDQVLMNLVVNARDAMPTGGRLNIETANVVLDEAYVAQHVDARAGEHVLLVVSDNGTGMDEEVKTHLFEPFFTTKEVGKGTGLGLATIYGIVRRNHGHIRVHSERGLGTTFRIYLPRAKAVVPPTPPAKRVKTPRHGETILVVEDDPTVRELAAVILVNHGYQVLTARDGVEALELGELHEGPIHLLLTDVVMPRMGGRELAERLLSRRPEARVLYTSGYTDDEIVRHGVLVGDMPIVPKPFTLDSLLQKVRMVLDGEA